MFGGLTSFTNPPETDWGERLLNTVASQAIRHLFSRSESVDVSVGCFPSNKLLQGSIDSFKMNGRGLVIRRQFPVEEMSFETNAVSIDFGSIATGQIRLKQPTQAIARVVLTEAGINEAFKAELVKNRLTNLALSSFDEISGGQAVSFTEVSVKLEDNNRIQILAKADVPNYGSVPISLWMTLAIERRRRIAFQSPQFDPDVIPEPLREVSQKLAFALAEVLDNMVDLDRFDLDGVQLRLNRMTTEGKKLIFSGYAQIERFPRTGG
jgi:LmeA-like phospholipid-binding